jgi:hypothetical protein
MSDETPVLLGRLAAPGFTAELYADGTWRAIAGGEPAPDVVLALRTQFPLEPGRPSLGAPGAAPLAAAAEHYGGTARLEHVDTRPDGLVY